MTWCHITDGLIEKKNSFREFEEGIIDIRRKTDILLLSSKGLGKIHIKTQWTIWGKIAKEIIKKST